mmetsp:Transcript_17059/g.27220  ORF Transcript_17059/g.27220 Transcript_17059/m.27220 type:complete len:293 (-) Transcript_17059:464-1342(-)
MSAQSPNARRRRHTLFARVLCLLFVIHIHIILSFGVCFLLSLRGTVSQQFLFDVFQHIIKDHQLSILIRLGTEIVIHLISLQIGDQCTQRLIRFIRLNDARDTRQNALRPHRQLFIARAKLEFDRLSILIHAVNLRANQQLQIANSNLDQMVIITFFAHRPTLFLLLLLIPDISFLCNHIIFIRCRCRLMHHSKRRRPMFATLSRLLLFTLVAAFWCRISATTLDFQLIAVVKRKVIAADWHFLAIDDAVDHLEIGVKLRTEAQNAFHRTPQRHKIVFAQIDVLLHCSESHS